MIAPKGKQCKSWVHFVVFIIYYYNIDATITQELCRFVNDSTTKTNKLLHEDCCFSNTPYLRLFAKNDIEQGKELRYDYGDEENMWWRENVNILAECLLV